MNWKPIVFTGILLASKFWEDLNFWNVDFVEHGVTEYPLKAINILEAEYLALTRYDLFVTADIYVKYYSTLKHLNSGLSGIQALPRRGTLDGSE